jgi:hypothetical protein
MSSEVLSAGIQATRIQVVRPDGGSEVLTLTAPLRVSGQCLVTSTGMEHFFTEEGLYDGWGMPFRAEVSDGADPLDEVRPFIEAIEKDREIKKKEAGDD